jgi:hypothetical protein
MRKATTALLLLLLAFPVQAAAASVAAPPGNSEADQYFETIPTPDGAGSPDRDKTVEDAVREGTLTPEAAQALEKQGADGRAIADVVAQTGPAGTTRPDDNGDGSPAQVTGSVTAPDDEGMGILFPLILAVMAAAALAFVARSHRRSCAE